MGRSVSERTDPRLLSRARDWGDSLAWGDLVARYDPLVRRWCRGCGLPPDSVDEACQRVWVELSLRLRTFRYDPSRSFRGFLRGLCRSRAIDLLRERRREDRRTRPLEEGAAVAIGVAREPHGATDRPDAGADRELAILARVAAEAQAAVRGRVAPRTWEAYWRIAIDDRPVRETAEALGLSYAAAFAARNRVDLMLRQEGGRRLSALRPADL